MPIGTLQTYVATSPKDSCGPGKRLWTWDQHPGAKSCPFVLPPNHKQRASNAKPDSSPLLFVPT